MKRNCVFEYWIQTASFLLLSGFVMALIGCGADHDHEHSDSHAHAHHAPHGGALSMLGEHAFQLELVLDAAKERLTLYVLDGEAERFVRISTAEIRGVGLAGGQEWELRFEAVSNEATGESVGDSSQFAARASELVKQSNFEVRFERLEILGQVYEDVSIPYPEGKH